MRSNSASALQREISRSNRPGARYRLQAYTWKLLKCGLAAALFAILGVGMPVLAQADQTLNLRLARDFGYSSGTGKIQGAFSIIASGPENLERVVFKIDDAVVGEASQAPFRIRFGTGDYSLGVHTITASAVSGDGAQLESNPIRVEFVSPNESMQSAGKIALPIIGITFGIILVVFLVQLLFGRGKRAHLPAGARRDYGMLGGGICPRCSRPFALHVFGLNLIVGKLDRCPYCGRWSLMRRRSLDELQAAEAAELEASQSTSLLPDDSEDDYRKQVEESRFL